MKGLKLSIVIVIFLSGLSFFFPPFSTAQKNIFFVDQSASGNDSGRNWKNAFINLQDALDAAESGDQVWVAGGIYLPSKTSDQTASFDLGNGVSVYGGFSGTEATLGDRVAQNHTTILSGDLGYKHSNTKDNDLIEPTNPLRADNTHHVVSIIDAPSMVTIDGLTISGGNAPPNANGGGLFIQNSHVQLTNIRVINNAAFGNGGGMVVNGGLLSLQNVDIDNNYSQAFGGGLSASATRIEAQYLNIRSNQAQNGGGIDVRDDSIYSIEFANLTDNKAYSKGGAIYSYYLNQKTTDKLLRDVAIENNWAADEGGGIYHHDTYTRMNRVTFADNEAQNGSGGALFNLGSTVRIQNSTFSENVAGHDGGAIFNTHFCEDREFGVCVNYDESALTLNFVTIAFNEAQNNGGGMFNNASEDSEIAIKAVLLTSNSAEQRGDNCNGERIFSYGFNFIPSADDCAVHSIFTETEYANLTAPAEIELSPLSKNGGFVKSHVPVDGSPSIDFIPPAHCIREDNSGIPYDNRQSYRPFGEGCDIGSVEWPVGSVQVPIVFNDFCIRCETEPNGASAIADGPLEPGIIYYGRFTPEEESVDNADYYFFEIPNSNLPGKYDVHVVLSKISPNQDYNLTLYDVDGNDKGHSGEPEGTMEEVRASSLSPGKYYIHVWNESRSISTRYYELWYEFE